MTYFISSYPPCLVLLSSLLASLELFQIPATDIHGTLVLIHAGGEVLDIGLASLWCTPLTILLLALSCNIVLLRLRGSTRSTAEEAGDGMAD